MKRIVAVSDASGGLWFRVKSIDDESGITIIFDDQTSIFVNLHRASAADALYDALDRTTAFLVGQMEMTPSPITDSFVREARAALSKADAP